MRHVLLRLLRSYYRSRPFGARLWLATGALLCVVALTVSAQAETPKPALEAPVTVHGVTVFNLRSTEPDPKLAARAAEATRALNAALAEKGKAETRIEPRGPEYHVFVGERLIIALREADARAAGVLDTRTYALQVSTRVTDSLRAERERSAIAKTVFSASLVVFFGLITLFLLRKVAEFGLRAQTFLDENPRSIPAVQLRSFEVLGPAAVRSILMVSLSVGRWMGLIGLVYAWVVVSLSMFESTRGYTLQLTGFVLSPISGLLGRIVRALPLFGVALIAIAAASVVVRLISLFFASVSRGETQLAWLPPELAPAASFTANMVVVVFALVFGAPIITGDAKGPLAYAANMVLVLVGIAIVPLLACMAVGIGVIFLRRLVVGGRFRYGGEVGRVKHIALTHAHLQSDDGQDVFVPHVLSLLHATHAYPSEPKIRIEIETSAEIDPRQVIDLLTRETRASVEVLDVDGARIRYRLARLDSLEGARTRFWLEVTHALREAGIALIPRRETA